MTGTPEERTAPNGKAPGHTAGGFVDGGRGRFRTADILLVRQALYP